MTKPWLSSCCCWFKPKESGNEPSMARFKSAGVAENGKTCSGPKKEKLSPAEAREQGSSLLPSVIPPCARLGAGEDFGTGDWLGRPEDEAEMKGDFRKNMHV